MTIYTVIMIFLLWVALWVTSRKINKLEKQVDELEAAQAEVVR